MKWRLGILHNTCMHASLWIFVCGLSNKCYESVYSTQTLEQGPWVPVPAMIRVERRFSNYCEMGIISLTDVCKVRTTLSESGF